MTPLEIIRRATADGVTLRATNVGTLKAIGESSAIDKWLPIIKASKPALIATLSSLPAGLEERMQRMFARWKYSREEASEFLELAHANPSEWVVNVGNDEIFHAALVAISSPLLPQ